MSKDVATASKASGSINYGPPTKAEQQAGTTQKQQDVDHQTTISQAASNPPSPATVVVTDASYYQYDGNVVEVRGYVSSAIESGGTCTATFTLNGTTVSGSNPAFKDATTTQCGSIDIPRSRFAVAGDWQVVLSYSSTTTSGQSAAQTVKIVP